MVSDYILRDAEVDDAVELGRAHSIAAAEAYGHYFPEPFMERNTPQRRAEMWTELLSESPEPGATRRVIVAERDGYIDGFCVFGSARDEGAPVPHELWRLYVLSPAYGSGLSARLLDAVNPDRLPNYLWVMENNPRAIGFYRKRGYSFDGTEVPLKNLGGLPIIRMVYPAEVAERLEVASS